MAEELRPKVEIGELVRLTGNCASQDWFKARDQIFRPERGPNGVRKYDAMAAVPLARKLLSRREQG